MEILSLGEKIKRRRKQLNMTLKDLAKDRITPGQISLVESGRSNPSVDLLEYFDYIRKEQISVIEMNYDLVRPFLMHLNNCGNKSQGKYYPHHQ